MKFCGNCGKQLPDGAMFCDGCGTKVTPVTNTTYQIQQPSMEPQKSFQVKDFVQKVKNNKKLMIAMIVAVVAIIALVVGLCVMKSMKQRVDINDCVEVEFTGYDSVGIVDVDIDEDKILKAVMNAKGKSVEDYTLDGEYSLENMPDALSYYMLADSIEVEVTPNESLKNGDIVTVKITYDEDLEEKLGVNIVAKEETYTVEGLEKVQEIDAFADLTVTFEGIAPNVTVQFDYKGENALLSSYSFSADKESGIAVGDKITVTIDQAADFLLGQGYKLKETSKEYTCESADEYITDSANIADETLSSIQSEAIDHIDAYFAGESNYYTKTDLTYEGCYILTSKNIGGWDTDSYVYVVYSTTVKSVEKEFDDTRVYIPVCFTNLMKKADGTQTFDTDYVDLVGSCSLGDSWFSSIAGYTDTTKMFNDIVVSNKANYTYNVSEELKQFGK